MAIDIQNQPIGKLGDAVADLGAWGIKMAKSEQAVERLTKKVTAGTKVISGYKQVVKESTTATTQMTDSLTMFAGAAMTGVSSIKALAGGLAATALVAKGVPPQFAAMAASLVKVGVALHPTIRAFKLWGNILKRVGKTSVALFKKLATLGVAAFKKLAKLSIAALKKLGTFAIKAFKKLAAAAVAMGKKILNTLKNLAIGIAGAVVAIIALPVALDKLFQKVMVGAGRLEGIKAAFYATGDAAGKMFRVLKDSSFGLIEDIDLMEKYNFALLLVGKTLADELPEALGYVTKIALATGEDLTYLMDSYIRGIGRLSPRILDNLGIQVSLAEAIAWASAEYGKASNQLSVYEKQAGMAAVALEKLRIKTEGLADPTGTLVYLMGRFNVTMAENSRLLASIFLPVAKAFYTVMNDLGEMFRKSISEGGKYYNVLRKLSAGFTGLIQSVGELVTRFSTAGSEAVDAFADKMFQAAWNAFSWGANIINNLAIGMARGVTTTLITVINMISDFLAYWLSPGSAPKIVPDLLAWGAATFTEYLRGFAMADFGILTGVQAPLERALDNLVALGTITPEQAGEMFINLSEAMAAAIAAGDEGWSGLTEVGGEYGAELEELFKRHMAVAQATKAVEAAERRLLAARKLEESSGKALSKGAREYNRLLREGATQAELAAKLAKVKASYETLVGAREEAELAEEAKTAAEERAKAAQELMQVQNALLQQLIKMGETWAGIGDGAGDDLLPDPDEILPPFASVISEVDAAFDALVESIKAKFDGLWLDLRAAWKESGVGKLIEDLKKTWEESNLFAWWTAFILDVEEEGLKKALENLWLKLAKTTQSFLDTKYPEWGNIWRAFTEEGIEDGSGAVDFGAALTALWIEFAIAVTNFLNEKYPTLGDIWKAFTEEGVEDGSGKVDFTAGFDAIWEAVKLEIIDLAFDFGVLLGSELATALLAALFGMGEATAGESTTFWQDLGASFVDGLKAGFKNRLATELINFLSWVLPLWDAFTNYFGVKSASTKFAGLGKDLVLGLKNGMIAKIGEISWASMGKTIKNAFVSGLSGLGGAIKGTLNSVISVIQQAINNIISGVNNLIYAIGVATGAWASYINYVSLPRLDQGGLITATEQLAVVHKNEVVLPLQDPRTVDLMADAMRGAFGQVRDADAAPVTHIKVDLHFGRDSVRSERDIMKIADQTQRAMELRGVRGGIQ